VARLIFRNGPYAGKALQLPTGKTITVGRNRDLELPLPDLRLSRRHCQLEYRQDGFVVRDLDSTNGTFLNGERLQGEKALRHLDLVVIGDTEMEFQRSEEHTSELQSLS
jgi:pSer/pThr/pTyr-binding forkhead associated (FHA) protein